jgi:hypothetical protein
MKFYLTIYTYIMYITQTGDIHIIITLLIYEQNIYIYIYIYM